MDKIRYINTIIAKRSKPKGSSCVDVICFIYVDMLYRFESSEFRASLAAALAASVKPQLHLQLYHGDFRVMAPSKKHWPSDKSIRKRKQIMYLLALISRQRYCPRRQSHDCGILSPSWGRGACFRYRHFLLDRKSVV